ncbi:hypothetical protein ACSQ67_009172 [Phaseolus vulgaris]
MKMTLVTLVLVVALSTNAPVGEAGPALEQIVDTSGKKWFVTTTGGVLGNPGSQTISNWFKIEKYEDAYKMVYCPSVCNYCNYPCSDIGIYQDQYGNRLALTSEPDKVQFQRVPS